MRFRMCCNLKTVPNIAEVSFVSAFGPLFEWNVPVFPDGQAIAGPPDLWALCTLSPFSPTSDTHMCIYIINTHKHTKMNELQLYNKGRLCFNTYCGCTIVQ